MQIVQCWIPYSLIRNKAFVFSYVQLLLQRLLLRYVRKTNFNVPTVNVLVKYIHAMDFLIVMIRPTKLKLLVIVCIPFFSLYLTIALFTVLFTFSFLFRRWLWPHFFFVAVSLFLIYQSMVILYRRVIGLL